LSVDADFPGTCLRDSFFVVAPTYRGEPFIGGNLGYYLSEGQPSPFDHDADDAIALLDATLQNVPETDGTRLVNYGRSRGGNVAYHVSLRVPRIRATGVLFGPSDFFLPYFQADAEAIVNDGAAVDGPLLELVMQNVVEPYLSGALTLQQARHILLRWSPVYFFFAGLSFQVHHGTEDDIVPIAHSERVDQVMTELGGLPPEYEFFSYPGAGHHVSSLTGYEARVEPYLCDVLNSLADVGDGTAPLPVRPLLHNDPNPFAGRTELVFSLGDSEGAGVQRGPEEVQLSIFDLSGRLVRTLLQEDLAGGQHRRLWDGNDSRGVPVAQGVYVARLQTGRSVVSHKLVLLR
jgi:predicted esterase